MELPALESESSGSNWAAFEAKLRSEAPEELLSETLSMAVPFAFRERPQDFEVLTGYIRSNLSLSKQDQVWLVGSGQTGFSLGPENLGAPFSGNSDLDLAVVSKQLFDCVWNSLLDWRYPWHVRKWPQETKAWAKKVVEDHFAGMIDPLSLSFPIIGGKQVVPTTRNIRNKWFSTFTATRGLLLPLEHPLHARLYRTQHALEKYQIESIRRAKREVAQRGNGA